MKCSKCHKLIKVKLAYVNTKALCQFCYERERGKTNGGRAEFRRTASFWEKWMKE